MKHVLIVAHGRSGSTLLQGILNIIDGWFIKGENFNFCYLLYQSYEALRKTKITRGLKATDPTHPWFGAGEINLASFRQHIRNSIQSVLLAGAPAENIKCCGFKEIRYLDILNIDRTGESLQKYLNFILSILEPCQLIFLSREIDDTCKSGWWRNIDRAEAVSQLQRFKTFSTTYCSTHPGSAFCIRYEDMIHQTDNLSAMFSFLDAAPKADLLQQVLRTPHSYDLRSFSPRSTPSNADSPSRPELLRKADRLYAFGCYNEARSVYRRYVQSFEAKEVNRLPFYAAARAGRQAYVVRSCKSPALAYFPIPKCACTSLSHLLYEVIHGEVYEGNNVHKTFNAGRAELSLSRYQEYFKFVVIRDPIERFISGYRNRIVYHDDLALDLRKNGKPVNVPDINTFADNLDHFIRKNKKVANHFQPQSLRLGNDLKVFDAVYPIEQIDNLIEQLSTRVGRSLKLGRYQESGPNMSLQDLSEKAMQKILKFYEQDYALLADYYSPDNIEKRYAYNCSIDSE